MKKTTLAIVIGLVFGVIAQAVHYVPPQKYGEEFTLHFSIYDSNSPWQYYETAPAADDVYVRKAGGAAARATNAVTDLNHTMSLVLTATEMTAAVVTVDVNDETAPPLFGSDTWVIYTHGHASAQNAFDLDTATQTVTTGSISNGAITAAAIASNAFTSDELATSFIDELQNDLVTNNNVKNSWAWYDKRSGGGDPLQITGTAQAGGSTNTIILASTASSTNGAYIPCTIKLLTGTGSPTSQTGLSYVGSTRAMTIVGTWPLGTPNATTTYLIEMAPSSYFAAEGIAQAGTTNTIQCASGDIRADDMTGLVILRSGTGSSTDVYAVRDSWDANDTLAITGTWSGSTPDTTTYYAFVPNGGTVTDTTTPTPGITIADAQAAAQAALTAYGYSATLATNLGTANSNITDILTDTGAVDTASELRTLLVGANIELATEPNQSLIKAITDRLTLNNIAYTVWITPWIGDPNFTRNTMGGLLKSKR